MTDHPLVAAAAELAVRLLEQSAAEVDENGVPRSHLDAVARAGLLGVLAPTSAGGAGAEAAVLREVTEILAGADAATWFVQAQHHSPVRMLAASPDAPAARRYLPKLAGGELIAGIAFSHVRRFPERTVTATRTATGWRFDGTAPWYTGWGLNDVAFVAGVSPDEQVVFGITPAREGAGLIAKAELRTSALDAARTVVLHIGDLHVDDADVALTQPVADWLAADSETSANANPAIFGVGRSALSLLRETGVRRGEPEAVRAADVLSARFDDVRARAYALADNAADTAPDNGPDVEARLAARAEALDLLITITSAAVAANSGPAMGRTHPAQRKAREALFLLVQAQTAAARAATLTRLADKA